MFVSEFTIFKSKCEELIQTSSVRYNKQVDHLQNEFKTRRKKKNRYDVKLTSTLNSTVLITNQMKGIISIVPRKLKNTLKETKQIIHQITLNPGM